MDTDDDEIILYVLESAAVGSIVKIGKDAGGNPSTRNAIFAAMDEDTKAELTSERRMICGMTPLPDR